ncbi:MAG: DUF2813 domain-containing protein, partial [Promethearchaeota archaeon]
MIKRLTIKSFKSIKLLELECNRINVFIGSPNTGKSNILEALSYISYFFNFRNNIGPSLEDFIRFDHRSDLFYDNEVSQPIHIKFDDYSLQINYKEQLSDELYLKERKLFHGDYKGYPFKYYKYRDREIFDSTFPDYLLPSDGRNLFFLLLTQKKLRELISDLLKPFDLSLGLR